MSRIAEEENVFFAPKGKMVSGTNSPRPRAALVSLEGGENIMHKLSTTFEGHIEILAAESPCALILEWGRRLELAVKKFGRVVGASEGPWGKYVNALLNDPLVGEEVSSEINRLRNMRNKVAHEPPSGIAAHNAIEFARKAEEIVWFLGRAQDTREGLDKTWALSLESSFPASSNK